MQRPSVFATLLLAAIGAAGLHQISGAGANPEVSTTDKPASDEVGKSAGLPISDGKPPKTIAQWEQEGKTAAQTALREEICSFATGGEYCRNSGEEPTYKATPETMIAILPDPIHTSIDLEFDRALESIQYGLQDGGWNLDRQWLPWTWLQSSEAVEQKTMADQVNQRFFRKGFEEEPGVVLFRHTCDKGETNCGKTLALFIVGSSPLSGVLAAQFRETLKATQSITGSRTTLNILGPSFSGALPSLANLLEEQANRSTNTFKHINIVEQASKDVLDDLVFAAPRFRDMIVTRVSFGAAASDIVHTTVSLLKTQLGTGTKVATLGEDESAYGRLLLNPQGSHPASDQPDLTLSFPRGIAHLRNAYERASVFGFGNTGVQQRFNLNLDLQTIHEDQDTLSSFSLQKPISDEAIVRQITSALQDAQAKVVILSATDVLDELFMIRLLYRANPDISIVVLDTDLLFLRPGDDEAYHHLFAVSPFPLMPLNSQRWTARQNRGCAQSAQQRLFSDSQAESVYLSTVLLGRELLGHDLHPPSNPPLMCLADYSSPFEATSRPPLWLLTRGVQGYWPLATMTMEPTPYDFTGNLPTAYATSRENQPNQSRCYLTPIIEGQASFPAVVAVSAVLIMSWLLIVACLSKSTNPFLFWNYGMSARGTQLHQTLLKSALCMLGLATLVLMLLGLSPYHSARSLVDLVLLTLVALAFTSILQLFQMVFATKNRGRRYAIVNVLVIITGIGFALVLYRMTVPQSPACIGSFFVYRAPYLFSGVSPLLPLLLLLGAIAHTIYAYTGRIFLAEPWKPRLPPVPRGSDLPGEDAVRSIDDIGGLRFTKRKLYLWASAVGATGVVWFIACPLPSSLDGTTYSGIYQILAGLVTILLFHELFRAAMLWFLLRTRLLLLLERTPLRRGFDRVRGVSWTMVRKTVSSDPDLVYLARRRARELVLSSDSRLNLDSVLHARLSAAWSEQQGAHKNEERRDGRRWARISRLLSLAVADVLRQLEDDWRLESGPVTRKDGRTKSRLKALEEATAKERTPAQEELAALAYIQYIRVVLLQVRDSLLAVAICFLLLSTSLSVYPFLSRRSAAHTLLYVFLGTTAVSTTIYLQMNRDPTLNRTTETDPGKLDLDFYEKIFGTISIPLVGLLLSLFPELSGFLLGLLGSTK